MHRSDAWKQFLELGLDSRLTHGDTSMECQLQAHAVVFSRRRCLAPSAASARARSSPHTGLERNTFRVPPSPARPAEDLAAHVPVEDPSTLPHKAGTATEAARRQRLH